MACRLGILNVKNTALFLCDMQEKFSKTIQFFPQIVSIANRILQASKLLDVPVIVTEQYPRGLGHTVSELGIGGDPAIPVIEKTQFSMMTNEVKSILESLKSKNNQEIKSIILCGIEAHVCVQGTCLHLLQSGYDVHVVVDAVSSRTQIDRMIALDRMKTAGAFLTTSESVILGLVADSAHPKFREVQKLIMTPAPDTGIIPSLKM